MPFVKFENPNTSYRCCHNCGQWYDFAEHTRCTLCGALRAWRRPKPRQANYGNPNLERKAVTK